MLIRYHQIDHSITITRWLFCLKRMQPYHLLFVRFYDWNSLIQINDSQHCLYQTIVYKYICYADQRFKEPGKSEMQSWFVIIIK